MKKYSFLILSILLISCYKKEEYFPLDNLNQIDGFWKASSNLIYIDSKDSTLTFNKLKKHRLKEFRGIFLIICFTFGAIFTPPDVISQFMLAVPMYILFELGLLFSNEKKT